MLERLYGALHDGVCLRQPVFPNTKGMISEDATRPQASISLAQWPTCFDLWTTCYVNLRC